MQRTTLCAKSTRPFGWGKEAVERGAGNEKGSAFRPRPSPPRWSTAGTEESRSHGIQSEIEVTLCVDTGCCGSRMLRLEAQVAVVKIALPSETAGPANAEVEGRRRHCRITGGEAWCG